MKIINKLTIIPNTDDIESSNARLNEVKCFVANYTGDNVSLFSFDKIAPIPVCLADKIGTMEYDNWLLNNWGTRKRASFVKFDKDDEIVFETETTPPLPIIKKIFDAFPTDTFYFCFSSEIPGKFTGEYYSVEGETDYKKYDDFSHSAYSTSFYISPKAKEDYQFMLRENTFIFDTTPMKNKIEQDGVLIGNDFSAVVGLDDKGKALFSQAEIRKMAGIDALFA